MISKNEIINLIYNYDLSEIEIGMLTFYNAVTESGSYIYFGEFDMDLLAIDKSTNEIVIIDHESTVDFIMCYCAENANSFLDALSEVWKIRTLSFLDDSKSDDAEYKAQSVEKCTQLAGGEKYFDFYMTYIGEEG